MVRFLIEPFDVAKSIKEYGCATTSAVVRWGRFGRAAVVLSHLRLRGEAKAVELRNVLRS
jgi:hypothetical protein